MQTLKQWLRSLFAWWPWKKPVPTDCTQMVSNLSSTLSPQDVNGHASRDAVAPQPGVTSVAIEHADNDPSEANLLAREEHPEHTSPSRSLSLPSGPAKGRLKKQEQSPPLTPEQQHLEFLRYLLARGLLNEGFEEGQVPDQYRRLHP